MVETQLRTELEHHKGSYAKQKEIAMGLEGKVKEYEKERVRQEQKLKKMSEKI